MSSLWLNMFSFEDSMAMMTTGIGNNLGLALLALTWKQACLGFLPVDLNLSTLAMHQYHAWYCYLNLQEIASRHPDGVS